VTRFAKDAFVAADAVTRAALCRELGDALAARVRDGAAVADLIAELRALGHDLWSFDGDGAGFEVWCPNWHTPTGPGIVVMFTTDGVTVEWSTS